MTVQLAHVRLDDIQRVQDEIKRQEERREELKNKLIRWSSDSRGRRVCGPVDGSTVRHTSHRTRLR